MDEDDCPYGGSSGGCVGCISREPDMATKVKHLQSIGETIREKRVFSSGASRDSAEGKIDFEGHLSPFALERYGEYMNRHRLMPDGSLRASDNWQNGMPEEECLKSALRHMLEVWKAHRSKTYEWVPKKPMDPQNYEESLCAVIFNLFTILHQRVTCGGCGVGERVECQTRFCKCKEWKG